MSREIMSSSLRPLFHPARIAVIGASTNPEVAKRSPFPSLKEAQKELDSYIIGKG